MGASSYSDVLARKSAYPNGSIDAARIAKTLKALGAKGRALDVGAGNGFFSKSLRAERYEVEAIELSASSREVFRQMNGFEATDVFFGPDYAARNAGRFGTVLLSQVLEHLLMDTAPIQSIHTLLEEDGICAIAVRDFRSLVSLVQGKRDMFITRPEHINYFTIESLRTAFGKVRGRFGRVGIFVVAALRAAFAVSDSLKRGMFVNLYAQKL